jgi:hypothetical protein
LVKNILSEYTGTKGTGSFKTSRKDIIFSITSKIQMDRSHINILHISHWNQQDQEVDQEIDGK